MSYRARIAEISKPLIDLVYPPRCPICGDAIGDQGGVCLACWSGLQVPGKPACVRCSRPLISEGFDEPDRCARCRASPPAHDGIAAGTIYNDTSRALVLAFKHGGRIALSQMLARVMVARLPALQGEWMFVPVPLHPLRLWRRGFNQAALLASDAAKLRGQTLLVDGLVRRKATRPLGGMGRGERLDMLRDAIAVHPKRLARVDGAQIILVDDVLTSGATTDVCVKALKQAGAQKVIVNCFARVLRDVPQRQL